MTPEPLQVSEAIEQAQVEAEELDEFSEQLAQLEIITEERLSDVQEGITECQTRLENLSTAVQAQSQAQIPELSQILSNLIEVRTEMANLRSQLEDLKRSMDSRPLTQMESASIQAPEPMPEESATQNPESRTVAPVQPETVESEAPKRTARYRRI